MFLQCIYSRLQYLFSEVAFVSNMGSLKMAELNLNFDVCLSVHRCIGVQKKNQLDATEWFIALIICSTCFGHRIARNMLSIL